MVYMYHGFLVWPMYIHMHLHMYIVCTYIGMRPPFRTFEFQVVGQAVASLLSGILFNLLLFLSSYCIAIKPKKELLAFLFSLLFWIPSM